MRNPTRMSSLLSWAILVVLALLVLLEVSTQIAVRGYPGVPEKLEMRLPFVW